MGKFDALKLDIKKRYVRCFISHDYEVDAMSVKELDAEIKEYIEDKKLYAHMEEPFYSAGWLGTDKVKRKPYSNICYACEPPDSRQRGSKNIPFTRDTWIKAWRLYRTHKSGYLGFEAKLLHTFPVSSECNEDIFAENVFALETLDMHLAFAMGSREDGYNCMNYSPAYQLP